mmetsp:Transcript_65555/g.152281  ORF Transcript_65555/g.152281 Transcript_65555/m.152281 type:complete len:371 (+) Transcript_65555:55-1167(+)
MGAPVLTSAAIAVVLPLARGSSYLIWRLIQVAACFLCWVTREVFRLLRESIAQEANAGSPAGAVLDTSDATDAQQAGSSRDDDFIVQRLRVSQPWAVATDVLNQAIDEVRAELDSVRLSLQAELENASVAVLGPGGQVRAACSRLMGRVPLTPVDPPWESFFALHFTMREAHDLPDDDELVDASLGSDWVDLGQDVDQEEDAGRGAFAPSEGTRSQSPRSVLRRRLNEVLSDRGDVQVFMDQNPFAHWGQDAVRVDLVGPWQSEAWDTVARAVLACEALGVYLSRQYDAVFWCPSEVHPLLEVQVACALSHWKGSPVAMGSGFGLTGSAYAGFEDLAANVSAVLRGEAPPGWHRLEWTPHGAGAVPHMTY